MIDETARPHAPTASRRTLARYRADVRFLESLGNTAEGVVSMRKRSARERALSRMRTVLSLLGNPERHLRIIHVAGTSGKGSVVKALERLIAGAGFTAGAYTSPFATTTLEKFSVNGILMRPDEFHHILEHSLKPALDRYAATNAGPLPSYFDACFAIALLFFREKGCAYAIIETGLGGAADATNAIDSPLVTAITSIGLDHTHLLGNTKEKIAREKAGIMKKGVPFLSSETVPTLTALFAREIKKRGAIPFPVSNLLDPHENYGAYFSPIAQKHNLNLALNILRAARITPPQNVPTTLAGFTLPARQEIVHTAPLVVLDGAHNADKLANVAAFIKTIPYEKLHLVIGMAADKRYRSAIRKLAPQAASVSVTRFLTPFRRALDPRTLARHSAEAGAKNVRIFMDPFHALDAALERAGKNDIVLVTGSFYLAGELRTRWISEAHMLGLVE